MEKALDKKLVITTLSKSPHGDLTEFLPVGRQAALEDPDFFAHLLAWNHVKGEVRDSKSALPIIALAHAREESFTENALAHLADLNPRMLGKILLPKFETKIEVDVKNPKRKKIVKVLGSNGKPVELPAFSSKAGAPTRILRRFVTRYLRDLEADRRDFERAAVQHSHVLMNLYAHFHVSRPQWVGEVLFHGEKGKGKWIPPTGSIFAQIRNLSHLGPEEAAGTIAKYRIPFIVARGALGKKAKESDQVLALIRSMSSTELVTNMKWLESAGVKTVPALRAALEEKLGKVASSKAPGRSTLKTTRAVQSLMEDVDPAAEPSKIVEKLKTLQEKQIEKLGGTEGDWLVLADKSGSMEAAIQIAREVTALLARTVKGSVHLIFFDTTPQYINATGKTFEELTQITNRIRAGGGTSIGCGLQYALDKNISCDGIVVVSDGGENTAPFFGQVYPKYCVKMGNEPTVYLYQTSGEADYQFRQHCEVSHIDVQRFDLRGQKIDYNSLPNLVKTMRVGRYNLIEEIMNVPLRTLDEVLDRTIGMTILPKTLVTV